MVEPIGEMRQGLVRQATERYICRAESIFDRQFDRIPVLFDLHGRAAGMFKSIGRERWLRYNPWIFSKYFEENLRDTVPHEVAHFVVYEVFTGRNVQPHGKPLRSDTENADQGECKREAVHEMPKSCNRDRAIAWLWLVVTRAGRGVVPAVSVTARQGHGHGHGQAAQF